MSLGCPDKKPCEAISPRTIDLEELRWSARVLLVFAPDRDHLQYRPIAGAIADQRAELEDREIETIYLFDKGPGRWGERPLGSADGVHLRHRFGVDDDEVTVVLLAKSGSELVRQSGDRFDLAAILAYLDDTPIRQRELMEKRRTDTLSAS